MDDEIIKHYASLQSKDADQIPIRDFMKGVSYDITYVKSSINELKSTIEQKDKIMSQKIERSLEFGATYKAVTFLLLGAIVSAIVFRVLESRKKNQ